MKGLGVAAVVCVALFSAAVQNLAAEEDSSTVQSKIIAMEKAWNQAFKLRDTKAIDALLADSVVLVNDDGSLQTKADFLRFVHDSKASDDEQVTPESIKVFVMGDIAVATGIFQAKGVEDGKAYVRHNRFADTWVRRGGSWVCASATATRILH